MYNCLVVEDNMIERDALLMHLSKIKTLTIVAECANGLAALEVLKNEKIDIVLSDIDMPDLSGIGLLKNLKTPPVFIFISSYSEYAVESFNLDVIDFIVKPASFERILKAITKATEYIELKTNFKENKTSNESTSEFYIKATDPNDFFFIKESNGHTKLKINDVLYVESMGDFSKFYTAQNKQHIVLISLKNIEKQLPETFFKRVHKQYIINLLHITSIAHTEIILSNNITVPLSVAYKQQLIDLSIDHKTLKRFG